VLRNQGYATDYPLFCALYQFGPNIIKFYQKSRYSDATPPSSTPRTGGKILCINISYAYLFISLAVNILLDAHLQFKLCTSLLWKINRNINQDHANTIAQISFTQSFSFAAFSTNIESCHSRTAYQAPPPKNQTSLHAHTHQEKTRNILLFFHPIIKAVMQSNRPPWLPNVLLLLFSFSFIMAII
jgi:hypothetical protein